MLAGWLLFSVDVSFYSHLLAVVVVKDLSCLCVKRWKHVFCWKRKKNSTTQQVCQWGLARVSSPTRITFVHCVFKMKSAPARFFPLTLTKIHCLHQINAYFVKVFAIIHLESTLLFMRLDYITGPYDLTALTVDSCMDRVLGGLDWG